MGSAWEKALRNIQRIAYSTDFVNLGNALKSALTNIKKDTKKQENEMKLSEILSKLDKETANKVKQILASKKPDIKDCEFWIYQTN